VFGFPVSILSLAGNSSGNHVAGGYGFHKV
jgi:hypothetical protein